MYCIICLLVMLFTLIAPITAAAPQIVSEDELSQGYITIIDEHNAVLLQTGITTAVGDSFISEANNRYEVISVEGNLAKAHLVEKLSAFDNHNDRPVQAQKVSQPLIAIYHTHTDESYIPTSGKASTPGKGDIIQVGSFFADKLNELGYAVEHSKILHEPHDANAYQRSRRTFFKLLTKQPAALFDLHRDSAPKEAYTTTIGDKPAVKLLLVVGRTNQNYKATANFAEQLKNASDSKYKGLIKGIFIAKGNYNQDLMPRAMLVEVGTQYNSQQEAERSIMLFSDVLVNVIKLNTAEKNAPPVQNTTQNFAETKTEHSALNDILIFITIAFIALSLYLILSTRDLSEIKSKLSRFFHLEWKDLFHKKSRK